VATIEELKGALLTEQTHALDVADRAITAIDTLLNLATWSLGILAFVVGIIAIFGYSLISSSAKKAAQRVATESMDSYIKSADFSDMVEGKVRTEVRERMKDKLILTYMTEEKDADDADAFPAADGVKK
jgi:hypothetical protein